MTRIAKSAALAAVALACTASPAVADSEYTTDAIGPSWTAASSESCTDPEVSPLLAAFKDDAVYAPAPGGAFETGPAGWQLEGGASIGSAIGGLGVLGASTGALDLPVGAAATSPTFCVDERYRHFRFSYAQESADADADVRVEVLYPGLTEKKRPQGRGSQGAAPARLAADQQDQPPRQSRAQPRRLASGRDPDPRPRRQAGCAGARRRRPGGPAPARLVS